MSGLPTTFLAEPCPVCELAMLYRTISAGVLCANPACDSNHPPDREPINDLAFPCPYCGHHTIYRPDEWEIGGPAMCANPWCDSNHPSDPALTGRPS